MMNTLVIDGGKPLHGEVPIDGAKNAALPLLAATLLTDQPVTLNNLPPVTDVHNMLRLLTSLGKSAHKPSPREAQVTTIDEDVTKISPRLMQAMRASILALGPLLAKRKRIHMSPPGGCVIGSRPIDLHLAALGEMGARFTIRGSDIIGEAPNGLHGATIRLRQTTVTGTENIMMAACLAKGTTIVEGAAREPEVTELAKCLNAMGARIKGAGGHRLEIQGVPHLHGTSHRIIPDRIEAGTYACFAAATRGQVFLSGIQPEPLAMVLQTLTQLGVPFHTHRNGIEIRPHGGLRPISLATSPYPGFPTDLQPQLTALLTQARGISLVTEMVFDNRMDHILELIKLGAHIATCGKSAVISGPAKLAAADMRATNLRAGAALVTAALTAKGRTLIFGAHHMERGYAQLSEKLAGLGAHISSLDFMTKIKPTMEETRTMAQVS